MKEPHKRNGGNLEKPFPGCMGRMVNLFDISPGAANKLLTEKAHRDGSIVSGGRPDVTKRVVDPVEDQIEDKPVAHDLSSSSKKSKGTPMKMLIAQEMLKETDSKHKPPSVVARLMGLDALPAQQPVSTTERSLPEGYLRNSSAKPGSMMKYRQQKNALLDKQLPCEVNPHQAYTSQQHQCKNVYEVWQQSSKMNYIKDQPRENGRYNVSSKEKKMALVRQKFLEAKRLATDEKLRQSKEFQDALEVLSSNRDLFLKYLQEPNSLFSKHACEFQSIPPPPQTKRITVLKPSKTLETDRCSGPESKSENQMKKQHQVGEVNGWDKDKPGWSRDFAHQKADNPSQPTRIVVLKPSPGNTHDIEAVASSPTSSPRFLHGRDSSDFYGESETDEAKGSREIAKGITQQMRESVTSNQSSEALPSSVFWNGYVGDESSFNRSENNYIQEGNLSDSEVMTPNSRHSWDYVNRYSSPYSTSSLSRASYSPESSVTREAKKRLSERWAMMASNGSNPEQRVHRRCSSTLGEMLALSATKKLGTSKNMGDDGSPNVSSSRSCDGVQEMGGPTAFFSTNSENRNEGGDDSPRNLIRSRSLLVSSTTYEKVGLKAGAPDPSISNSIVSGELAKPKGGKSSLKGRVSSLFFSRNKNTSKEQSSPPPCVSFPCLSELASAEMAGVTSETKQLPADRCDDTSQCVPSNRTEEGLLPSRGESSSNISSPSICVGPRAGVLSSEGVFSLSKSAGHANSKDNLDQPSPISVLEAPFEDDTDTQSIRLYDAENRESPGCVRQLKSDLTTKCTIESVTRALSWDGASLEVTRTNSVKTSTCFSKAVEEEREWFSFVQTLLSAAGLDQEKANTDFTRWYSLESPLDPSLLEKYMVRKEEDQQLSEAKRRQRRSEKRLVYDCVNAALLKLSVSSSDDKPSARSSCVKKVALVSDMPVTQLVWTQVKEWLLPGAKQIPGECNSSLFVEMVVRKEVVGGDWVELMGLEADGIGKEIEKEMLKELIEETSAELTCGL